MGVQRWVITDPSDTDPTTNRYVFPRNPSTMTNVYPERQVSSFASTAGKVILFEGATQPRQWTFTGPILDKQQFLDLQTWVYTKKRRLILTDHYSRQITLVFTALEMLPKRRVNYYYSHDYTVTALILSITAATVPETGPVG